MSRHNFERIHTKADRSKTAFRQDAELVCGDKTKMPKHIARQVAEKKVGRAYQCKFCGWWHFSATEHVDYVE